MSGTPAASEQQMTDDELHATLLRYNPEYKKSGKLSENERQIKLKQLHHFQVRERKELEAREKEAKLREKEEMLKQREAQRKEKELSKGQKKGRASVSASQTSMLSVSLVETPVVTNGGKTFPEVDQPKEVGVRKRGRKTMSEVSLSSTESSNEVEKEEEQVKQVKGPRRGRHSMVSPVTSAAPVLSAAPILSAAPVASVMPTMVKSSEAPPAKKGRAGGRKSALPAPEVSVLLSPIREEAEVNSRSIATSQAIASPNVNKNDVSTTGSLSGIEVSVVNEAMGLPAYDVKLSLYFLNGKQNWMLLAERHTQTTGLSSDLLSGVQFKRGMYKLQVDTTAYFSRLNTPPPVVRGSEVTFEIKNPELMHRVGVNFGPHHCSTNILSM